MRDRRLSPAAERTGPPGCGVPAAKFVESIALAALGFADACDDTVTGGQSDARTSGTSDETDGQSMENIHCRYGRRHAGFLRLLPHRLCPGLHHRRLAPDIWPVGRHPAGIRHRRADRLVVLGLDGRQDRAAQGHDPDGAQLLPRHRRDGADAAWGVAVLVRLPFLRRHGRHRPLHRGHRDRAGVRAGYQTRLDHRPHHQPAAGWHAAGRHGGRLVGALDRLARAVRRGPAARRHDACYPGLGPGIAALADRQRTPSGGA